MRGFVFRVIQVWCWRPEGRFVVSLSAFTYRINLLLWVNDDNIIYWKNYDKWFLARGSTQ